MKFPALTRVFSIILAILSAIVLLVGILGIGSAISERDESVHSYELLEARIDTYKELSEKLADSPTYDEANEQYEAALEDHNKKSDEHKTDLATYSATEGGLKSGEEAMETMDTIVDIAIEIIKNLPSYVLDDIDASIFNGENIEDINTEDISDEELAAMRQLLGNYITSSADDVVIPFDEDTLVPESEAKAIDYYIDSTESVITKLIVMYDTLTNAVDSYIDGKRELTAMELENLKKGIELAVEKYELMRESDELEEQRLANEQLKEDENKLKSTRVHLLKNSSIESAVNDGENIIKASEAELSAEKENTKRVFGLRIDSDILLIVAGIAGLLGIAGAFEIKKSRPWLIIPVAVCALFSAAADGISIYLGRGQLYSALAAFVFAVIQLIIIIPRAKKYIAD